MRASGLTQILSRLMLSFRHQSSQASHLLIICGLGVLEMMADSVVYKGSSLCNSDDKLRETNGGTCLYCDELSFELQKAKLEMLSYEKVMELLQEELSNKELRTQT